MVILKNQILESYLETALAEKLAENYFRVGCLKFVINELHPLQLYKYSHKNAITVVFLVTQ